MNSEPECALAREAIQVVVCRRKLVLGRSKMIGDDAAPPAVPPLVANARLALRILSLLPPCPPRDRVRATSACRALRGLASQLPVPDLRYVQSF